MPSDFRAVPVAIYEKTLEVFVIGPRAFGIVHVIGFIEANDDVDVDDEVDGE